MRSLPLLAANARPSPPAPRTSISTELIAVKAKIFCHGLRIADDLWRELTDEHHYKHKRAGLSQGRFFQLQHGGATSAVNAPVLEPFVARSPLYLEREDGRYRVYEGDTPLAWAHPFAWPRWYQRTTRSGKPMSMVVSAHCDTSLYTALYQGGCDYWQGDQMCAFCAMKIDQKAQWRPIDDIIEVARAALAENPAAEITFGGGTRLAPDKSARHKAAGIAELKRHLDMPVCVEMAAPDTDDWLDRLKDSGLDGILMNLELWDPDRRRSLMPGKSAITRERYLGALRHAAGLFGQSQVSSQVIVGLEPIEDTLAAIRAIVDAGAIPLPVVFRPLPGTPLADHPTPSEEDVIRVFLETYRLMSEAGLAGADARSGCALCGACSAHR